MSVKQQIGEEIPKESIKADQIEEAQDSQLEDEKTNQSQTTRCLQQG